MPALHLDALRQGFTEAIPHSRHLGQVIEELQPGQGTLRQPYRPELLGDVEQGLIHSSVQTSLMDTTFGVTVFSALGNSESIATLDLRMDYLQPALAAKDLWARASIDRITKQVAFVSGVIWQDDPEQPITLGRACFMRAANTKSTAGR
nr:PaaI family thioesterase [Oceanococcus sp. HetDA_MAG_MS8]